MKWAHCYTFPLDEEKRKLEGSQGRRCENLVLFVACLTDYDAAFSQQVMRNLQILAFYLLKANNGVSNCISTKKLSYHLTFSTCQSP